MLDLLRSDPKTSEEEHFKLQLVSTEVERVKYLIRSYLRCRLDKVRQSFVDLLKAVAKVLANVPSTIGGKVFSSHYTHARRAVSSIRTGADTRKAVSPHSQLQSQQHASDCNAPSSQVHDIIASTLFLFGSEFAARMVETNGRCRERRSQHG